MRRQPPGEGQATLHVTEWLPEVRELALRLLRHCGHRGLAAVEFKRDPRDDVLFIAPRARAAEVRRIVERLEQAGRSDLL